MLAKKWDRACVMYGWEHQCGRTNDVGDTCPCATVNVLSSVKPFRQCNVLFVYGDGKERGGNECILCFSQKLSHAKNI